MYIRRGRAVCAFILLFFAAIIICGGYSVENRAVSAYNVRESFRIELNYRGNKQVFNDRDFEIKRGDPFFLESLKRRGTVYAEKAELAAKAKQQGHSPEHIINYILPLFDKKLDVYAKRVEKLPIPAAISFDPYSAAFSITKEAAGFNIDRDDLYMRLLDGFIKSASVGVAVKMLPVHSDITVDYWKKATFLKSSFSTDFSSSGENRRHNIALAASFWHGKRIEPGAEASFNKIVGPRTEARGFKEGKIILNGKFEDGIGGGVCQVSTTLYNAALIADMEISAARHHSLPVSYVQPSFDATVSSTQDFKFVNTTEYPVFIRAWCSGSRLYVQMYGVKNVYRIERRSEKVKVIPYEKNEHILDVKQEYLDKVKYKGEKAVIHAAKNGLISKGYLKYYHGNKLVKEVCIRTDKYLPQNGLTVEGIMTPPPPPPVLVPEQEPFGDIFFQNAGM